MKDNYIETWDEELGFAQCVIPYVSPTGININGYGEAKCSPEDRDFQSQLTGGFIAQSRAEIDLMRNIRDYELKPCLMSLKHLLGTMQHSKKYNPKSYEARRLNKEIINLEEQIAASNELIKTLQIDLNNYLLSKEKLFQRIRAHKQAENK